MFKVLSLVFISLLLWFSRSIVWSRPTALTTSSKKSPVLLVDKRLPSRNALNVLTTNEATLIASLDQRDGKISWVVQQIQSCCKIILATFERGLLYIAERSDPFDLLSLLNERIWALVDHSIKVRDANYPKILMDTLFLISLYQLNAIGLVAALFQSFCLSYNSFHPKLSMWYKTYFPFMKPYLIFLVSINLFLELIGTRYNLVCCFSCPTDQRLANLGRLLINIIFLIVGGAFTRILTLSRQDVSFMWVVCRLAIKYTIMASCKIL
jgi:hypothetical protein